MAHRRAWPRSNTPQKPPTGSIRVAALRLLGRRDYTQRELSRKLTDKGYPPEEVATAIAALSAEGLVDDRRAAAAHVRTASRVKGRGPARIKLELQARGLAQHAVAEATADLSEADVRDALERVLARKRIALPVPADARPKLYQQLLRRGFPPHLISAVLRFKPETDD